MKIDLLNLSKEELKNFLTSLGEKPYRAQQIFTWLHRGAEIDEMTDISKNTRELLKEKSFVHFPKVAQKLISKLDGTVKYLFALSDGQMIESVLMKYKHGNSICISSQAGCRMGCAFCASTLGGRVRNLEASEMLGQVISAQKDCGERISNIVLMGIGEPLDNYDNVIKFLHLVGDEGGLNIGYRHISLSTCGIVPKIYDLAEENIPVTLSVSLHAASDTERSAIMPVNNKWGLDELLAACRSYFDKTGRRISFEYTLIQGQNDSPEQAYRLANLLHKYFDNLPFHINLIPVNEVEERSFKSSMRANDFRRLLESKGINATVRRRLGADINASCGQLRRSNINQ